MFIRKFIYIFEKLNIISGIKTSSEVKVGDTITHVNKPCEVAIGACPPQGIAVRKGHQSKDSSQGLCLPRPRCGRHMLGAGGPG